MNICDITSNNYICKDETTNYIINEKKLKTTKYMKVDNGEISLTILSSNHYLQTDEKAHCKGKWQDWFCIHNYHNNNNINNYPNTNTMSIGVCYNYCELLPSQPKTGEIITKYNKCAEYYDENDIIYNPLALIAIFGTHFYNKTTVLQGNMPSYDSIQKTIGIRGSYLNDLYRVNKKNEFISFTYDEIIKLDSATNNQDKLLFNIIKYIVNNDNVYIIEEIKTDIGKACNNINNLYLKKIKGKPLQKEEFLSKIKNYVFDIEKLEKLYGKDKNDIQKLINIIAYSYNIMRLVCYNKNIKNEYELLPYDMIKINIKLILIFNNVDKNLIDNNEDIDNIVDIFTSACYNCFNVNFDVFNNYRIVNSFSDDILIIYNKNNIIKFDEKGFIKCNINDAFFVKKNTTRYKYDLIYYNDVPFYDHNVLSEYSDNIKNIDKILLGLLVFFIGVIIIFLLYWFLFWVKVNNPKYNFVDKLIYLINFSHLFYKRITFGLLYISCRIFYNFVFNFRSNYSILSLLYKIFNILFILYLISYLYSAFIELLNIDYIKLLKNINYSNFTVSSDDSDEKTSYSYIPYYILVIYLILIYIYSTYIIKYSLSDSQFDIIANIDADSTISLSFVDYLLLRRYAEEMLKYKPLYPETDR